MFQLQGLIKKGRKPFPQGDHPTGHSSKAWREDADACQQQGGQLCRPAAQGVDDKEAHELGRQVHGTEDHLDKNHKPLELRAITQLETTCDTDKKTEARTGPVSPMITLQVSDSTPLTPLFSVPCELLSHRLDFLDQRRQFGSDHVLEAWG